MSLPCSRVGQAGSLTARARPAAEARGLLQSSGVQPGSRKPQLKPCPAEAAIERQLAIDLLGQNPDDPKAQRLRVFPVEAFLNTDTVIVTRKREFVRLKPAELHSDSSSSTVGN